MTITDLLIKHEGIKLKPYVDTRDKLSIGVGRNLTDVGISLEEAMELLKNDIAAISHATNFAFPWFMGLTDNRKNVILSLVFNMGIQGFQQFHNLIGFMEKGDCTSASVELLNSKWALQVGPGRSNELATMLREG